MTGRETSSFEKGSRCRICTGCGRCFGKRQTSVVSGFFKPDASVSFGRTAEEDGEFVIAADIGTTTIAMQLRRTADDAVLDEYTCLNPQRAYGADVLSRIEAAGDAAAREAMGQAVRGALDAGVKRFAQYLAETEKKGEPSCIRIAGNTTMLHLLMGYDVSGLGRHPFAPYTLEEVHTELFGLKAVLLPGISAFVGADITADICVLGMDRREEITLLLDLGTNGEMVLGNRERLIATAVAAGPAFEGGQDAHGADLMALTARLLKEGILDGTGLMCDPYFEEGIDIGGVRLTQAYIRQLQTAKAAVCTGISVLCEKYGIEDMGRIGRVFLAGGMGYYLDAASAAAIGLFPEELAGRAAAVGNAALEGAYRWRGETRPAVQCCNLASEESFAERYIGNMSLGPVGQRG